VRGLAAVPVTRRRGVVLALAVAVGVVGVGAGPIGGGAGPASGTASASTTGHTTAVGCGKRPVPSPRATATNTGDVVQSLQVGSAIRSYRLAVPTHYRAAVATPLILLFHGSGSNALQTSIYTQMPRRAARRGYLVATPDGVAGQWQLSAPGATTDDLAFVSALIANLSSRYCVDPDRIYAAGISLGSEFSAIAACTPRDHIAAVGLVAAEFLLRPCTGPIPVIAFHGTADPIVAYRSGSTGTAFPGIPVVGVEENLAHWARLDRCSSGPQRRRVTSMVVRRSWSGCSRGSAVVLYSVLGGGHTWPGSPITLSAATFGATTRQIDATGLMLTFFGQHRLDH
jgi:polyhydroxybutyrate depolymerase